MTVYAGMLPAMPEEVYSNGVMTEITGGIAAGTEVLADFNISGGEPQADQQAGNPFMPRPRNNRNSQSGGNASQRR